MRIASTMVCGLALGAFGCTDGGQSILIVQNQVPGDACSLNASGAGVGLGRGVIDVASPSGYVFNPVVRNLSQQPLATENGTRIAFIEGFDVDITYPGAGSCTSDASLTTFSRPIGLTVDPSGTGVVSVEIVPQELLASCSVSGDGRIDLTAEVTMFGQMDGGDIETNTFPYPIQVCDGCTRVNLGLCTEFTAPVLTGNGCNAYQDFELSCCQSSTGATVCPAVKEEVVVP